MIARHLLPALALFVAGCALSDAPDAPSAQGPEEDAGRAPPPSPDAGGVDAGRSVDAGHADTSSASDAADAADATDAPEAAPDDAAPAVDGSPEADGAPTADGPPAAFVHASGVTLLDPNDKHLLLRTAALGNWLLNEGYMWDFSSSRGDRSRRIEARITEMIGATDAAAFWKSYRDTYVTEDDVTRIAALGFNSVRVAMNARLLLPEGQDAFDESQFAYLTNIVSWGTRHGVYVILDMHGAPGGQTGKNIDDDANDSPDLFTTTDNQDRLVRLWTEIAHRFANEPAVGGYDLLNEPLPSQFSQFYSQLWPLYQRLGKAIRGVDTHHLLIVEGGNWANDWSTLGSPFDDNMAYSFHKYWNGTDIGSIQGYLDYRSMWQRPIWCGETGENDDSWYSASFKLLEDNDVGWCFWTWKKMDSGNNPYSVPPPSGWSDIVNYVDNSAGPPAADAVKATLAAYVSNAKLANCTYNHDVVCSITPVLSQQPGCP
jgi:hypothetical protein